MRSARYEVLIRNFKNLVMIDMKARTKQFTIESSYLCSKLPTTREFNAYVNQLIRCSSSVGAI
jgi:hypothetical protein